MIRFGPAGIPLSCKGRTLQDGVEDVHNLSLNALEVQMVRPMYEIKDPDDDEIGKGFRDIQDYFVLCLDRDGELVTDPDEPIEETDGLIVLGDDIVQRYSDLGKIGSMAKWLDVSLSIHTPYYMDLGSDSDLAGKCVESIQNAALILNALEGDILVTSLGVYKEGQDREAVDETIYGNLEYLLDWWSEYKIKPKFGVEITGQQDVFGSLDQVLDLCKEFDGVTPVVNFSHHHSRTNGSLLDMEDFIDVLEEVSPYCDGRFHLAFAGVEYADGDEKRLTPIKKGDLKFDPLAEALMDLKPDATVISTSPLLEHDAMYMRIIHERILSRKVSKMLKDKKKSEGSEAGA